MEARLADITYKWYGQAVYKIFCRPKGGSLEPPRTLPAYGPAIGAV